MKRIALVALACAGSVTLLSGCTEHSASATDGYTPGPTVTSTVAPDPAVRLAEHYRHSGGVTDVYGLQRGSGPGGVPLVTVWTHNSDDDPEPFEELKESITDFLRREEGVSLHKGYLMDVFGPDGRLQHRLDARP